MKIGVVIPCYRVTMHIIQVLAKIGPEVSHIYVIDDACPDHSGDFVELNCTDKRVKVLKNAYNLGVGGAVKTGYKAAINDGMEIIVKLDGDEQMDPHLIKYFIKPIASGNADYTKGNRFYEIERVRQMPMIRIFGNAILSLAAKFSTGYWNIFDVTNGYTAIHRKVLQRLPLDKISNRYFFETDMLFRLNTIRAVVLDIPMDAIYGTEKSHLKIHKILMEFLMKNITNLLKRIFYNYFLRDMTIASLELLIGAALLSFGIVFGAVHWMNAISSGVPSTSGTVMLAALPSLIGLQLLIAFMAFDMGNVPRHPIHESLDDGHSVKNGNAA